MRVNILGSSSKGNCYLLQAENETLILECGLPFAEMLRGLNFDLKKVVGCIVSHEHRDHSRALATCLDYGIRVMALKEVFESHGIKKTAYCNSIKPMRGYKVGGFKILALEVSHDVQCLAFVIEHSEMGKMLFVTDTMFFGRVDGEMVIPYGINGLNHVFLECNYSNEMLTENIKAGVVTVGMRKRLQESHMELQTAKKTLKNLDLSNVVNIVLIHLSPHNSEEGRFRDETTKLTGLPVLIAKAGMELELSNKPI